MSAPLLAVLSALCAAVVVVMWTRGRARRNRGTIRPAVGHRRRWRRVERLLVGLEVFGAPAGVRPGREEVGVDGSRGGATAPAGSAPQSPYVAHLDAADDATEERR